MTLGKHISKEEILAHVQSLKDSLNENWGDEGVLTDIRNLEEVLEFADWCEDPEFIRSDWFYGGYCQYLVDSMGSPTDGWPYDFIDWGLAAEALRIDYKAVEILGETYYVRS